MSRGQITISSLNYRLHNVLFSTARGVRIRLEKSLWYIRGYTHDSLRFDLDSTLPVPYLLTQPELEAYLSKA